MLFVACPLSLHALFVPGCLPLLSGGGYGCPVAQDLISLWKTAFPRALDVPLSHDTEFRNDYVPNMSNPLLQQTLNEEKKIVKKPRLWRTLKLSYALNFPAGIERVSSEENGLKSTLLPPLTHIFLSCLLVQVSDTLHMHPQSWSSSR